MRTIADLADPVAQRDAGRTRAVARVAQGRPWHRSLCRWRDIAHVDDLAAVVLARFMDDRKRFAAKFPALAEAFDRLHTDQPAVPLDG
jgi:hypothetical protein